MRPLFALAVALLAHAPSPDALAQESALRFEVSFPASVEAAPITGRVFLAFADDDDPEPRLQVGRYGVPFFGIDVEGLAPGRAVVFDATAAGYPPESLGELPEGDYVVQAIVNRYNEFRRSDGHVVWMHDDRWEGQDWRRSPGNLVSDPVTVRVGPAASGTVALSADRVLPPVDLPPDTEWVKQFRIRSEVLSAFWGRDIWLGMTVLLPRGYSDHPDAHYPTLYQQGHFSLRPPIGFREGSDVHAAWTGDDFPRFIAVTIQHPTPYFDDSYAVNSANNGPYGDAIHQELIPEFERRFRAIPEGWARVLTGGSTGGWESFALQVFYPDFYGGSWAFAPDPLDFRNVEGINIYEDANAFHKEYDWYRVPTINTRDHETGDVRLTSRQRNRMELVNGTRGRSGEQLDIWSAVFGPVGDDGYFRPLFDKGTGEIDPEVAAHWREHYDLRHILERDWATLGPKLVGKLHTGVGLMDNFFLDFGVYHMEEFLESTTDPYYAGEFWYGKRGGHGWRPFDTVELVRRMADHVQANAPAGADLDWLH
jgi:hypothetical protein